MPDYPAGGRIVFRSDRDGNGEVYVMGCDGTSQVNLTNHPADDKQPSWAKGGLIAFSSDRNPAGGFDIYLLSLNPWKIERLTTDLADDESPAMSPDGSRVAFVSYRDGNAEIYALTISGNSLTKITNSSAADMDPAWSPDGNRIAFASDRDGTFDIYTIKADGSSLLKVAAVSDGQANDRWPDFVDYVGDEYIALASDSDGDWEVYYYDAYDLYPATGNMGDKIDADPSWSRSGEQMVYHTNRDMDSSFDVWKAYYDGFGARNLTRDSAGNHHSPDWEPQDEADFCVGDE